MNLALPIVFSVFSWWISTGFVLWLINRPVRAHRAIGRVTTILGIAATVAIIPLREETTVAGAYLGFLVGLMLWAWHEVMFLLGFVSGPRKTPCPPGLSPAKRFWVSTQAILHHEIGIAAHALVIALLSIGASNAAPAVTFCVLWAMKVSAKLLVFFGAPNIPEEFLPPHLRYLGSYFAKTPHPPAALCALGITSAAAISMVFMVRAAMPGDFAHTILVLLTTLTGLAVLEHVALVVRLPDRALFSWALRPARGAPDSDVTPGRTSQ